MNGVADTVNDLAFGLAGVLLYLVAYTRFMRWLRAREPRRGSARSRVRLERAS